jgi:post-segregation antitoxin (ccd killing protein)
LPANSGTASDAITSTSILTTIHHHYARTCTFITFETPHRMLTACETQPTHEILETTRMRQTHNSQAAKRPVNLTISGDLLEKGQTEDPNVSALAEDAIATELARRARQRWDTEIAEACAAHERYLSEYGSASDLLRAHLQAERGHNHTE